MTTNDKPRPTLWTKGQIRSIVRKEICWWQEEIAAQAIGEVVGELGREIDGLERRIALLEAQLKDLAPPPPPVQSSPRVARSHRRKQS